MSNAGTVIFCLLLAWLLVAACSKPTKKWFTAFVVKDRKGRVGITLVPARKKKTKRRRSK